MSYLKNNVKSDCCGCSACNDACPVNCIEMKTDKKTFFKYPVVDKSKCINCLKCEKVCPVTFSEQIKNKLNDDKAYAVFSKNSELIYESSSGGAFSMIMDDFSNRFKDNFAIFGAAFEGFDVVLKGVTTMHEAKAFKKSKYVQATCDGAYKYAKKLLDSGSAVLFSGTPCIVAALKTFLGRDYDKLYTVDIVCHGVPNNEIFKMYLNDVEKKYGDTLKSFSFRVKKNFDTDECNTRTVDLEFENKTVNLDIKNCEYLYSFHNAYCMRPSCHECRFATPERVSDITLADFWGINKKYSFINEQRGVSMLRINTQKGKTFMGFINENSEVYESEYSFAVECNEQLRRPMAYNIRTDKFYKLINKGVSFSDAVSICKKQKIKIYHRVLWKIKNLMRNISK